MLCLFTGRSRKQCPTIKSLLSFAITSVGSHRSHPQHRHPQMEACLARGGAKRVIHLLCFRGPTLKRKNDRMHYAYRIPKRRAQKNGQGTEGIKYAVFIHVQQQSQQKYLVQKYRSDSISVLENEENF